MTPVDVLIPSTRGPEAAAAAMESARRACPGIALMFQVVKDPDRRGPAWARNRAVEQGSAPLIALLDDDDRWLPGRLTDAVAVLDRPEVALVCGDAVLPPGGLFLARTRGGRRRAVPPGDHGHADLVADCFVCASTVTLRRVDWERSGGMPEDLRNAEDYALWLRLTADGRVAHVLPDALARYGVAGRTGALDVDPVAARMGAEEALRREARVPVPADRFGRSARSVLAGCYAWRRSPGRDR